MRLSSPVPHKRARIEIIPLIDIMFFLLASFMMVSLSQTHMKGIRVNLPAAKGPPPSGVKDFVSVKVLEGNAVFFDNQYVPEDQVLPRLFDLHRGNPDIKISISAAPALAPLLFPRQFLRMSRAVHPSARAQSRNGSALIASPSARFVQARPVTFGCFVYRLPRGPRNAPKILQARHQAHRLPVPNHLRQRAPENTWKWRLLSVSHFLRTIL